MRGVVQNMLAFYKESTKQALEAANPALPVGKLAPQLEPKDKNGWSWNTSAGAAYAHIPKALLLSSNMHAPQGSTRLHAYLCAS